MNTGRRKEHCYGRPTDNAPELTWTGKASLPQGLCDTNFITVPALDKAQGGKEAKGEHMVSQYGLTGERNRVSRLLSDYPRRGGGDHKGARSMEELGTTLGRRSQPHQPGTAGRIGPGSATSHDYPIAP